MGRKIMVVISLVIGMVSLVAPVWAGDICEESITTVCIGCHNTDRICDNLGASEKTWKELLEWMVANGAELDEPEIEALAKCFSGPSPDAKAACSKW